MTPPAVEDVHGRSLRTSTTLTSYFGKGFISPIDVITTLNAAKVRFVLIGTHAMGGWMREPRATPDVDVLVSARNHRKAVRALLTAFPQLEDDAQPGMARLRHRETKAGLIDVVKPLLRPLPAVFTNTCTVALDGLSYAIPALEMALAMRFASMRSPSRALAKQYQDAHDFLCMVKANAEIIIDKLARLGDRIGPDVGKTLVEEVQRVRAGERFIL